MSQENEPQQSSASFFEDGKVDLSGFNIQPKLERPGSQQPVGPTAFVSKTQTFQVSQTSSESADGVTDSTFFGSQTATGFDHALAGGKEPIDTSDEVKRPAPEDYFEHVEEVAGQKRRPKPRWKMLLGIATVALIVIGFPFAFLYTNLLFKVSYFEQQDVERHNEFREETGYNLRSPSPRRRDLPPAYITEHAPLVFNESFMGRVYPGSLHSFTLDVKAQKTVTIFLRDMDADEERIKRGVSSNNLGHSMLYFDVYRSNGRLVEQDEVLVKNRVEVGEMTPIGELTSRDLQISFIARKDETLTIDIGVWPDERTKYWIVAVES